MPPKSKTVKLRPALGYVRSSALANANPDKDSVRRQKAAISGYAAQAGFKVTRFFEDPGVSGADPVHERAGFDALLRHASANGIGVILFEVKSTSNPDPHGCKPNPFAKSKRQWQI